jgi:hypothetical protein
MEQHLKEVHGKQPVGLTNGRRWVFDTCGYRKRRKPDFRGTTPIEFEERATDEGPDEGPDEEPDSPTLRVEKERRNHVSSPLLDFESSSGSISSGA